MKLIVLKDIALDMKAGLWALIFFFGLSFYFDWLFSYQINDLLHVIFEVKEFSWGYFFLLKALLLVGLLPLFLKGDTKHQLILWLSTLFFLLPSVTYSLFYSLPIWYLVGPILFNLLIALPIQLPLKGIINLQFRSQFSFKWIMLLVTFSLVVFVFVDVQGRFHWSSFLFQNDLYDVRRAVSEEISSFGKYAMSWLTHLLLPLLIVYFGLSKSKIWIVLPLSLAFLLYAFNPHKTILFNALLASIFALAPSLKVLSKYLVLGFLALLVLGRVEALVFTDRVGMIEGFMVRRLLFLPVYLSHCYLEYFQEPIYLSHSVFKSIAAQPFLQEPSEVIGEFAYPGSGANANNGIFSDGYMNFGVIGFFLWTILGALCVRFLLSCATVPQLTVFIVLVLNIFKSSPFLTSLKTHGVLVVMLLFLVLHLTDKTLSEESRAT